MSPQMRSARHSGWLSGLLLACVAILRAPSFVRRVFGSEKVHDVVVAEPSQSKFDNTAGRALEYKHGTGAEMLPPEVAYRWQQYEGSKQAQSLPRTACVGSVAPSSKMASLARQIVWRGNCVDLIGGLEDAFDALRVDPEAWRLLIIDIDHAEKQLDLDDIVKELMDFREVCRSITIVLLSDSFYSNDGSLIRTAIADYCFKASVSNESIIAQLPAAYRNHACRLNRDESKTPPIEAVVLPFKRGPSF